jgi:hypothetical protein
MNLLFVPRYYLYLEILGKSLELMYRYVTFTGWYEYHSVGYIFVTIQTVLLHSDISIFRHIHKVAKGDYELYHVWPRGTVGSCRMAFYEALYFGILPKFGRNNGCFS